MSRIATACLLLIACSVDSAGLAGPTGIDPTDAQPERDAASGETDARIPFDAAMADAMLSTPDAFIPPEPDADVGPAPGTLRRLRWEIPCGDIAASYLCVSDNGDEDMANFDGEPGTTYDVTLHIRGVTEEKSYTMGTADGYWYVGGRAGNDDWATAGLEIDDPPATYFVNAGTSGLDWCVGLDYQRTVRMRAGALVRIWGFTRNSLSNRNIDDDGTPIVIPGAPPDPMPYDGQFVQIDLVSATPL